MESNFSKLQNVIFPGYQAEANVILNSKIDKFEYEKDKEDHKKSLSDLEELINKAFKKIKR